MNEIMEDIHDNFIIEIIDEFYGIDIFFPVQFRSVSEKEYIEYLFRAVKENYRNQTYQFSLLSLHLLFMSFIYYSVWKIKQIYPQKFKNSSYFASNRDIKPQVIEDLENPFSLSVLPERTVFEFFRFIEIISENELNSLNAFIKKSKRIVDERNNIAHAKGQIEYEDISRADNKIKEIISLFFEINLNLSSSIKILFDNILKSLPIRFAEGEELNITLNEFQEILTFENYFSQADIRTCLNFDINSLSSEPHFSEIKELFDEFVELYKKDSE